MSDPTLELIKRAERLLSFRIPWSHSGAPRLIADLVGEIERLNNELRKVTESEPTDA